MRPLTALVALLLFASAGVAKPGSAAVVPFTGTMSIQIGQAAPVSVPGGGMATVNGSAGGHPIQSLQIPPGAFATSITVPVQNVFPIVQLRFPLLANGSVAVTSGGICTAGHSNVVCPGGGLAGFGPLMGTAVLGLFYTHTVGSGSGTNVVANLFVPLGVVGGGSTTNNYSVLGVTFQVSGAGWTTGTAAVYNPTAPILTHAPSTFHVFPTVSFYASQSVTAGYGTTQSIVGSRSTDPGSNFNTDRLMLVSPIQIFTNATTGFVPSTATISIHLVPEPGALVLLGTGMAGFVLFGRRLRKRSRCAATAETRSLS
jgi:hypothetical protein